MDDETASTCSDSRSRKDKDDMQEFMGILETHFKGRKCYLGQYDHSTFTRPGTQDGREGNRASPFVGSLVVTLEPCGNLVLGVFLSEGIEQAWQFWEGEFGPSELAAHRSSLGWDGHSLKTFADCFMGAVAGVTQPQHSRTNPAKGDPPSTVIAEEYQQRAPEFSENVNKEGSHAGGDDEDVLQDDEQREQKGDVAFGTLDLHYAGAGIIGSWGVRHVQGGVSAALIKRNLHAACGKQPTDPGTGPQPSSGGANTSSPGAKSSVRVKAKRRRFVGKGAKLIGAQSTVET